MVDNIKELIRCVVCGDIAKAKKAAAIVLSTNSSKKDDYFCRQMLSKLRAEPTMLTLPANISSFAKMEDLSNTFMENRYYLSEREEELYKSITKADNIGKKLAEKRIRCLNASLLYGDSGTGKTTFGRFLAYKLDIPFLYLNFSYLISSLLGKTGQNIQLVFDYAKQQRCVLMLDELDAIGIERGGINEVGEMSRIVIALMQALDTLGNDVILLAATNRYDIIDNALKRRFPRKHQVVPLTAKEKFAFGKAYLSDCGYDLSAEEIAAIISTAEKQSEVENRIIQYIIDYESEVR